MSVMDEERSPMERMCARNKCKIAGDHEGSCPQLCCACMQPEGAVRVDLYQQLRPQGCMIKYRN